MGSMGFIEARGHAADGVALTDTEVYALSREKFGMLVEQERSIATALLEAVARNLSSRLRVTITELQALRG
jgi:SulP family sulfate permease